MASVTVHCPRCHSDDVYRHGRSCSWHERFRCRSCKRVFQLTCSYKARKSGIKELSVEMAHNGAGVRDTPRTLKIGINTVIRTLKSSRPGGQHLRLSPTLMLPLSVNSMNSGTSLAAGLYNTGSGTLTTLKLAVYSPTLSCHGTRRPVGNC